MNELRRLNDLRLYKILDTAAEKVFDDLTYLASTICDTPIGLVSFIDEERQWFKSHRGLDVTETPREHAFCHHAIQGDGVMVVEDALKDSRFSHNPLVTGDPNIRFYAGAPLRVASGSSLGTLCVIDRKPRTLTDKQIQALETLGSAVISHMELRRALDDLQAVQNLIPLCAWCRQIRVEDKDTGKETWQPLHEYVSQTNTVTHGICPGCKDMQFTLK